MTMNRLLNVKEVAEYLNVKPVTVRRRANSGEIPSVRIGSRIRFHKHQIDRWLLEHSNVGLVHVLVVDDEPIVGQLFKDSLDENAFQVTTTLSSLEALELIGNRHFDLIFLDLVMPDLDGVEVLKRIREAGKNIPVVIITGYSDSDLMNKALGYGPFTVMKKPFTGEEIVSTVHSFIEGVKTNR